VKIDAFTLFPEAFDWFSEQRHVRNAIDHGLDFSCVDYRDTTELSGRQVDDTPFGGGAGMLLRVDVVEAALAARYENDPADIPNARRVVAMVPNGKLLDDQLVDELAATEELTVLCGRYEGFDERILEHFCTDRVSIGRYVVAGGELPAMVLCDAVVRKLPFALGDDHSAVEESYSKELGGAPEYPHYTRPAEHRGWAVPQVLLSGNHALIDEWRRAQSAELAAAEDAARRDQAPTGYDAQELPDDS
jgi:tRNA (guanine37-N1)-methyltransferase